MDIASLCESLSLSDDEDLVVCDLGEKARNVGESKIAHSLVGKVLSTKKVNREGFISAANYLWRTLKPMVVESVGENMFVVHFESLEDRRRIMGGGPWRFQELLIVLEAPTGLGNYSTMKFDKTSFWVQIHNLPLMGMTREAGLSLGAQIGEVEEVDPGATGDCLGKYLRVRVKMDITKPLKRGLKVKLEAEGAPTVIMLKYERLPDLCMKCGIIGHPILECSIPGKEDGMYKYNETIRAGPTQRFVTKGKRQKHGENGGEGNKDGIFRAPEMDQLPIERGRGGEQACEKGKENRGESSESRANITSQCEDQSIAGKGMITGGLDLVEVMVSQSEVGKDHGLGARKNKTLKNGQEGQTGLKLKAVVQKPIAKNGPKKKYQQKSLGKRLPLLDITQLFESGEEENKTAKKEEGRNPETLSLNRDYDSGKESSSQSTVPAVQDRCSP
ncbi:uncharacterized protein LOC126672240 [Mercurialis annua]|uniref:uncharacterized protein LOC126672240 n=1 Tax=Mercurialis annua TaxID=3986 RepID=UPI00215F9FEF|nr:uncharacterized protein LOC126672240 [Mercurialis annua]